MLISLYLTSLIYYHPSILSTYTEWVSLVIFCCHSGSRIVQHSFSVVRSAGSSVYNYANPVRRDTTNNGGSSDNVTIRFRTDNPGPWFFHWYDLGTVIDPG